MRHAQKKKQFYKTILDHVEYYLMHVKLLEWVSYFMKMTIWVPSWFIMFGFQEELTFYAEPHSYFRESRSFTFRHCPSVGGTENGFTA